MAGTHPSSGYKQASIFLHVYVCRKIEHILRFTTACVQLKLSFLTIQDAKAIFLPLPTEDARASTPGESATGASAAREA